MTISDATGNQEAGTRAGGNVETKGASKASDTTEEASPRAGCSVETKGASSGTQEENPAKGNS
jgi:hypothetical protein